MIRRLTWLILGAVLGVTAYRRLTALTRSVSPGFRRQQLAGFVADVREGMALYMEQHPGRQDRTLEGQTARPGLPAAAPGEGTSPDDVKDGR
ncbi:MAG: hypothetical protein LBI49_24680 [Nocardiopsaceae bacterium]|jgi:hypothetical protein|nr:hypothetical protein [Nocardiopsaceae bacterium]